MQEYKINPRSYITKVEVKKNKKLNIVYLIMCALVVLLLAIYVIARNTYKILNRE